MAVYSKHQRIKKSSEFRAVFTMSKSVIRTNYFRVYWSPGNVARIGIVIKKSIVKHSVHRNYIKRVVRELFRHQNFYSSTHNLMLVYTRKNVNTPDFDALSKDWGKLMLKVCHHE